MERLRTMNGSSRQRVTSKTGWPGCRSLAGYHGQEADPLQVLKNQLLAGHLADVRDAELEMRLRRAADESASIAWATTYPLLTLPELLLEKTAQALAQHERQREIQLRRCAAVGLAA
jgi:hypothetical protein